MTSSADPPPGGIRQPETRIGAVRGLKRILARIRFRETCPACDGDGLDPVRVAWSTIAFECQTCRGRGRVLTSLGFWLEIAAIVAASLACILLVWPR